MKKIIVALLLLLACCKEAKKSTNGELISAPDVKNATFRSLQILTNQQVPEQVLADSLAFLILPVEASCPACRKKTVDSIVKYKDKLRPNHFIIIAAKGGRKFINSYFIEEEATLPEMEGRLFLDSTDQAGKLKLYDAQPTFYYTHDKKAFRKVIAVPSTVRQDLKEFFSGETSFN